MFVVNDDNSIYANRGDGGCIGVEAKDDVTGEVYEFQAGDELRITIYGKKDAEVVLLQKDFPIAETCDSFTIELTAEEMTFGEVISKPKDYWYDIKLNPETAQQTIVGYFDEGPALFRLYPESIDIETYEPDPEDFPVVDEDLDLTSPRPVANSAITAEMLRLRGEFESTLGTVTEIFVTPQMFGAVGDGVEDDTEALQAALDSCAGKAGSVYLPQGQYRITAPLTIKGTTHLYGAASAKYGRYGSDIPTTVIYYDGEETESLIKYDRDGANVFGGSISNLTLDGGNKVDYVVNLCKSGRVAIANNSVVKSLKAGIYASSSYENIIKENWFGSNKGYGISLTTNANANVVRDNAISLTNEASGILLSGCNGNVVSGNMIEGGYGASIGIHVAAAPYTTQNMITENRVEFESHRYEGQTEGICILIGEDGAASKPLRCYVCRNAVYNQVVVTSGAVTEYNHKNEFQDYGLSTVTDFYDYNVLSQNAKMIVSDGVLEGYQKVDDGFSFSDNGKGVRITLTNAVYEYPVVYQGVTVKDLRGEQIALSCMIRVHEQPTRVRIEYYKDGTDNVWGNFGTYITAKQAIPYDNGVYQLVQVVDTVPDDCDTAVIVFSFGAGNGLPADTITDVEWCKLSRLATWK